jgi:hypothetical protein
MLTQPMFELCSEHSTSRRAAEGAALCEGGFHAWIYCITGAFLVLDDLDGHRSIVPEALEYLREGPTAKALPNLDVMFPQVHLVL